MPADPPIPGTFRLAAAVYAERDDKILLLKRAGGELTGAWYLPGGTVDEGETPEEAAVRELAEETGLVVDACEHLRTWSWAAQNNRDAYHAAYITHAPAGDVVLSHEHTGYRWMPLSGYRERVGPAAEAAASAFGSWIRGVRTNLDLARDWAAANRR